jgi:hypothetical protein
MPTRGELGYFFSRLALCLATAVVVSATAYWCAYLNSLRYYVHTDQYAQTRVDIERLHEAAERYKKTNGKWPADLKDVDVAKKKEVRLDDSGEPVDGWGRPFLFRNGGDSFLLYSRAEDGLPGGVGKYADLYSGEKDTWPDHPTLAQFSALRETVPVRFASLLAGLIAFPLCLMQAREVQGVRPSLVKLLLANVVTAVFAVFAAMMMAALHLMPGGH